MNEFNCSECGARLRVPKEYTNQTIRCPKCNAGVLVAPPIAPSIQVVPGTGRPATGATAALLKRRARKKQTYGCLTWLLGFVAVCLVFALVGVLTHDPNRPRPKDAVLAAGKYLQEHSVYPRSLKILKVEVRDFEDYFRKSMPNFDAPDTDVYFVGLKYRYRHVNGELAIGESYYTVSKKKDENGEWPEDWNVSDVTQLTDPNNPANW